MDGCLVMQKHFIWLWDDSKCTTVIIIVRHLSSTWCHCYHWDSTWNAPGDGTWWCMYAATNLMPINSDNCPSTISQQVVITVYSWSVYCRHFSIYHFRCCSCSGAFVSDQNSHTALAPSSDKPLSELMMFQFTDVQCDTRPQFKSLPQSIMALFIDAYVRHPALICYLETVEKDVHFALSRLARYSASPTIKCCTAVQIQWIICWL